MFRLGHMIIQEIGDKSLCQWVTSLTDLALHPFFLHIPIITLPCALSSMYSLTALVIWFVFVIWSMHNMFAFTVVLFFVSCLPSLIAPCEKHVFFGALDSVAILDTIDFSTRFINHRLTFTHCILLSFIDLVFFFLSAAGSVSAVPVCTLEAAFRFSLSVARLACIRSSCFCDHSDP